MEKDGQELAPDDVVSAVDLLLAQREAAVAAVGWDGLFVPMPAEIGLVGRLEINARSALDIVEAEDRAAVIAGWGRMRSTRRGIAHVRMLTGERVTLHFFDTRADYGVCLMIAVAAQGGGAPLQHLDPARPRPRRFSMSRNEFALATDVDLEQEDLLGWPTQELIGRSPLEIIHPDDQGRAIDNWMATLATPNEPHRWRGRYLCRDGTWLWMEITNTNHLDDPAAMVVSELVDISDEMRAHEMLQEQEQLLRRLAEALPLGVLQVDVSRHIVYANDQVASITGTANASELVEQLATIDAADHGTALAAFDRALNDGLDADLEVHMTVTDAAAVRERICKLTVRPLYGSDAAVSGAIACIADVTETVMLRRELEHRATFDALTGCMNRAAITACLDATVDVDIADGTSTAVVFIDLDEFKQINDRFGHETGDELLCAVAERIQQSVRPADRVGRLGGDEFLVVCPGLRSRRAAEEIADRIVTAIGEPLPLASGVVRPSASAGIAFGLDQPSALVSLADEEMYRRKRAMRVATDAG